MGSPRITLRRVARIIAGGSLFATKAYAPSLAAPSRYWLCPENIATLHPGYLTRSFFRTARPSGYGGGEHHLQEDKVGTRRLDDLDVQRRVGQRTHEVEVGLLRQQMDQRVPHHRMRFDHEYAPSWRCPHEDRAIADPWGYRQGIIP